MVEVTGRVYPVEVRYRPLTEPLAEPIEVSGFVDAVLKASSDAPDTDFAVKLVDVAPDGTAYILADTILRARYRDGFDAPKPMRAGEVYTIRPTPMTTSMKPKASSSARPTASAAPGSVSDAC